MEASRNKNPLFQKVSDPPEPFSLRGRDLSYLCIIFIPYTLLVRRFWFVTDDAFISFRYARNWASGYGPRYNLGDHTPVEGYSNFLWVAASSAIERLGGEVTLWPLIISFMCGALLLYLVYKILRQRLGLSFYASFAASFFLACSPAFAVWSTSGLETMPFTLLLFLTFERLILKREGVGIIAGTIAGLGLCLIRVEGVYWALLFAPMAAISRHIAGQRWLKPILTYLALVIVGYAVYWSWRYSYYQFFFPNTFYVKVPMNLASMIRGANYAIHFYLVFPNMLLVFPSALFALRKGRRDIGLPLAGMCAGVFLYAIAVGGDYMTMGRYLIPALPFSVILMGWCLFDLRGVVKSRVDPVTVLVVIMIMIGLTPAWNHHLVSASTRAGFEFRSRAYNSLNEYDQWFNQRDRARKWGITGRALKDLASPADTLVMAAIGAVGYYSGLFIFDRCGLVNREVAFREFSKTLFSPGHDKCVPKSFFLDQEPVLISPGLYPESLLYIGVKTRHNSEFADKYVSDFLPVQGGEDEQLYVVVLRRIPEGTEPGTAWKEVLSRVEYLRLKYGGRH